MGLLEKFIGGKKTIKPVRTYTLELEKPVLIYKGIQTKGFRGYKKIYMVCHNNDDETNYINASKLRDKYGQDFIGSEIKIEKINYDAFMGNREYLLKVYADEMPVGVIFSSTSDQYDMILNSKIEGAYCRTEEENELTNKGTIINRYRTNLFLKLS